MDKEILIDPVDFIKAMNKESVKYLLIGRQALVQYGAPLQSFDYDFYISPEKEDLEKVLKIARSFNMETDPLHPGKSGKFTLFSANLKVDIFRARKYVISKEIILFFDEMYARKQIFKKADFYVQVPDLLDLKRTKLIRQSPKDKEDLKYIEILLKKDIH
jgi:hypothetical protein